jgi:hypothetical protein
MGCCSSCASPKAQEALEVQGTPPSIGIPSSLRGSKIVTDDTDPLMVSGEGAALASSPIEQDAAYWEIKVVKAGAIRLGVARKLGPKELEGGVKPPKGGGEPGNGRAQRSWCADIALAEGDNVGVAFGQADLPNLSFTKNGKPLPEHDVKKIGGMVYPVFSVGGGACIKVLFESGDFENEPPRSFSPLMVAQSVI